MGVWDPGEEKTVLSQIKKAIGARYQALKGWGGMILPGILIGFYFFIFFLLLSGCAYFKKEKKDEIRPRGKWSDSELNQVKFLKDYKSASEVGKIFGATKNAIIGALYRDKIRNGYGPSEDSKYTGPKNL